MKLRKNTLIQLLERISKHEAGLSRMEMQRVIHCRRTEDFDKVRTTSYPHGLKGLVSQKKIKEVTSPKLVWICTEAGRALLESLKTNPDAMPVFPTGTPALNGYARLLLKEQSRKKWQHRKHSQKHSQFMRHPKHHKKDYDTVFEDELVDIRSPDFKKLDSLSKIRILRARSRRIEVIPVEEEKEEMPVSVSEHPALTLEDLFAPMPIQWEKKDSPLSVVPVLPVAKAKSKPKTAEDEKLEHRRQQRQNPRKYPPANLVYRHIGNGMFLYANGELAFWNESLMTPETKIIGTVGSNPVDDYSGRFWNIIGGKWVFQPSNEILLAEYDRLTKGNQ